MKHGMNIPMRKLLFASIFVSSALSVLAQGIVQFQNRDTLNGINSPIYIFAVGSNGILANGTDTGLRAALLGGPPGTPFAVIPNSRTNYYNASWSMGGLSMLANPSTGATWTTFRTGTAAGYVGVGSDVARVLPGIDYGGNLAEVQVVAWTGGYNTWAEAYAAAYAGAYLFLGASNPLIVSTPASATDMNLTRLVGLESFSLIPSFIPEPSTFALAGLSAAATMIFRRRK
jgi:hypothetical protein